MQTCIIYYEAINPVFNLLRKIKLITLTSNALYAIRNCLKDYWLLKLSYTSTYSALFATYLLYLHGVKFRQKTACLLILPVIQSNSQVIIRVTIY